MEINFQTNDASVESQWGILLKMGAACISFIFINLENQLLNFNLSCNLNRR